MDLGKIFAVHHVGRGSMADDEMGASNLYTLSYYQSELG